MNRLVSRAWWIAGLLWLVAALPVLAEGRALGRLELVEAIAGQHVTLRYTIENQGDAVLQVLRWNTPLTGFYGDILDVRVDGQPVPYIGRLYKLGRPGPEDFIRLEPGDVAGVEFELGEQYLLDRAGHYRIDLRDGGAALVPEAKVPPVGAEPLEFAFDGLGAPVVERFLQSMDEAARLAAISNLALIYQGCSGSQQSAISAGFNQAKSYATGAYNYGNGIPGSQRSGEARYRTWFGSYSSSRYAMILGHYRSERDAFNSRTFTFICDCADPNVYAYVYPGLPYQVHPCGAYWKAPTKGTDSKGGTIIHETTHFYVIAGTKDYAYGQTNCKALAKSSPTKAVMNADSHEYYAENNPPIGGGGGGAGSKNVAWTITDDCLDGRGFRIRAFDSYGNTYPSWNTYWLLPMGTSGVASFNAPRGSTVCLGAVTDPPNQYHWCAGINGEYSTGGVACCGKVPSSGTLKKSTRFTC